LKLRPYGGIEMDALLTRTASRYRMA